MKLKSPSKEAFAIIHSVDYKKKTADNILEIEKVLETESDSGKDYHKKF